MQAKIAFKDNVRFKRYTYALHYILDTLFKLCQHGYDELPALVTITSINDSLHSHNSKHYKDEALDIRSKNFATVRTKFIFRERLEVELNKNEMYPNSFTVLLEDEGGDNEHFHVQVKKGLTLLAV